MLLVTVASTTVGGANAAVPTKSCGSSTADIPPRASTTCGGLHTYIDGPWVYKAGECRFCGGGIPVRSRVRLLRAHQTVAIGFGTRGTPKRFAEFRELRLRLPGMVIREGSSANPGTGNADPKVANRGDTYVLTSTPSFRKYGGRDLGGLGDEVLAILADPMASRVCPRITVRFTDRTVIFRPGCWAVARR